MTTSTYRLFQGNERLATARGLKNGSVYQVWPSHKEFETLDTWKGNWPTHTTMKLQDQKKSSKKKKPSSIVFRRNLELMQFFDEDYKDMYENLTIRSMPGDPQIKIVMKDGTVWDIVRSLDFMLPPNVMRNGHSLTGYDTQYSPAFTTAKWWMMLAFTV